MGVTRPGARPGTSPSWSRGAGIAGVLMIAALVVADVVLERQMSGTYAGGAVLAAILATRRRTLQVAGLALVAAVASGVWNHNLGDVEWAARLLVCLAICVVAVGMATVADRRRGDLEHTTELAQRVLDALAVELTGARTTKEVAEGFVNHAVRTLGAHSAMVLSLDSDDVLRSVVWDGRGGHQADRYQEIPLASDVPGAVATRTRTDLHLRTRRDIERAFPDLVGYYQEDRSLHVLPLHRGGRALGVLAMTFPRAAVVAREDGFLHSVAGSLTSALLRAEELERADAAAQRTALLAEASLTLARHLEVESVLQEVGRLLVPRFADWCSVQLLEGQVLRTAFVEHRDAETTREARHSITVFPTRMDRDTGAPQVVRTGRSELHPFIPAEVIDAAAVDEEHRRMLRRLGFTSAVIVPLRGRTGILGALTLIHADSGRRYAEVDVPVVEELADRVALALDTATTFTQQSARLADVSLVADAVQRAILSPPPDRLGAVRLSARYRSAAREAQVGGDLYEVVTRPTSVRLLIGDVRGKGLGAVRTATIVLGEFRAAAARLTDLTAVAREIDRRLGPYLSDPEDFVTAALVEIHHDGRFKAVSCGHPAPILLPSTGRARALALHHEPPLGLGVDPQAASGELRPGDRLLLFTDGLIEARTPDGAFLDPMPLLDQVAHDPHEQLLDHLLEQVRAATSGTLDDDLALLLACYDPGS